MMGCVRGRPANVQVRSSAFPAAPEEASSSAEIEEISQEELAAAKVGRNCTLHTFILPVMHRQPVSIDLPVIEVTS